MSCLSACGQQAEKQDGVETKIIKMLCMKNQDLKIINYVINLRTVELFPLAES